MSKSLVEFDGFGVTGNILPEHVEKFGDSWSNIGLTIVADKKKAKSALARQASAAAVVAGITKARAEQYLSICADVGYVSGKYNDQTQPVNVFLNACELLLGIKRSSISTAAARIREERNPALKEQRKAQAEEKKSEKSMNPDTMAVQLARITPEPVQTPELATDAPTTVLPNGQPIHVHINLPSFDAATPATTEDSKPDTFAPIRLYFREGEKTPDGRVIDPNAVNFNRPPPYSIMLQTARHEGHQGAVVCGVITKIVRVDLAIVCDGFLDLTTAAGQEAFNLINNRTMQTWSPDLGDAVVDYEQNVSDEDTNEHDHLDELAHFVSATFLGATLVAMPALASAVVELLDASGNILVPAPERGNTADFAPEPPSGASSNLGRYITARQDSSGVARYAAKLNQVTASCVAPVNPPASFFTNPNLTELTRFVELTSDGRVYGHSAGFGECHIGFRNQCISLEYVTDAVGDGNFEYAKPGRVQCDDGSFVNTGPIAIKGGHADSGLALRKVHAHYDDPDAVVADVTYGVDQFGVWFSGAIRPTATPEMIRTLLASGVSLDAREIAGKLRYLATCCVNTPGYHKLKTRLVASADESEPARITVLIAPDAPEPHITDDICDEAS